MSSSKQQLGQTQHKKFPVSSTATLLEVSDVEEEHSVYSQVIFSKELAQSSLLSGDVDQRSASQFGTRPRTLFDDSDDLVGGNPHSEQALIGQRQPYQQRLYTMQGSPPQPKPLINSQRRQDNDSHDDEDEYKFLVRHLQKENEQLLIALQRNHDTLIQCRQDKRMLEDLLQDQRKLTLDKELEDWMDGSNPNSKEAEMEALVQQLEQRQRRDTRHRDDLLFQKRYLLLANAALEACEQESVEMLQRLGMTKMEPPASPSFKWRACVWAIIAVRRFQSTLSILTEQGEKQQLSSSLPTSQLPSPTASALASALASAEASVSYSRY